MRLISRVAGTLAAVALAASSSLTPAQAAPGDTVLTYAPTAVVAELSCVDHAVTYAVELPPNTTDWTLDLEVMKPDGTITTSELLGTFSSAPSTGTVGLQLCGPFDPPGTYQIFKTSEYRVGTSNTVFGARTLDGTFQVVRAAKSKVALGAKRKGAKIVATAKVSVSTGDTYSPVGPGGPVVFQKKVGKKWKTVDKAVTGSTGKAKGTFKSRGKTQVRAVFKGMGEAVVGSGVPVPPSTSKVHLVR